MRHAPYLLALAGILIGLYGCISAINGRETNYGLPLVNASQPASVVPWRLLTTCPIDRRNVPQYRERIA